MTAVVQFFIALGIFLLGIYSHKDGNKIVKLMPKMKAKVSPIKKKGSPPPGRGHNPDAHAAAVPAVPDVHDAQGDGLIMPGQTKENHHLTKETPNC